MTHNKRWAAKVDKNQQGIVGCLRGLPGVSVELRHDDILVGYNLQTFWFEVKDPKNLSTKTGRIRESARKDSQKRIERTWTGQYDTVWSVEQILDIIGYKRD